MFFYCLPWFYINCYNLVIGKHQEAENIIHNSFQGDVELDTVAYNTYIKAMLEAG